MTVAKRGFRTLETPWYNEAHSVAGEIPARRECRIQLELACLASRLTANMWWTDAWPCSAWSRLISIVLDAEAIVVDGKKMEDGFAGEKCSM
jgi:hypothetical protein